MAARRRVAAGEKSRARRADPDKIELSASHNEPPAVFPGRARGRAKGKAGVVLRRRSNSSQMHDYGVGGLISGVQVRAKWQQSGRKDRKVPIYFLGSRLRRRRWSPTTPTMAANTD
jgi:hypothetical protein